MAYNRAVAFSVRGREHRRYAYSNGRDGGVQKLRQNNLQRTSCVALCVCVCVCNTLTCSWDIEFELNFPSNLHTHEEDHVSDPLTRANVNPRMAYIMDAGTPMAAHTWSFVNRMIASRSVRLSGCLCPVTTA